MNQRPRRDLTPADFDPTTILPDTPWVEPEALAYAEQLDLAIRQQCWIRPNIGRDARTPYATRPWVEFMLNVPTSHRRNRSLFKQLGREMYPELFQIPTETNNGVPFSAGPTRRRVHREKKRLQYWSRKLRGQHVARPNHQFMDWEVELRQDGQFSATVKQLIVALADTELITWFDPLDIWDQHQQGENLKTEVRLLASLGAFIESRT